MSERRLCFSASSTGPASPISRAGLGTLKVAPWRREGSESRRGQPAASIHHSSYPNRHGPWSNSFSLSLDSLSPHTAHLSTFLLLHHNPQLFLPFSVWGLPAPKFEASSSQLPNPLSGASTHFSCTVLPSCPANSSPPHSIPHPPIVSHCPTAGCPATCSSLKSPLLH